MKLTIDSSIFVESTTDGVHCSLCSKLLGAVYIRSQIKIIEPAIFLYEFVNAISKAEKTSSDKTERMKRARKICEIFLGRENVEIWPQDKERWLNWMDRRKGKSCHKTQDELFLYTANHAQSTLVTLDARMLEVPSCSTGQCTVIPPYDCLELILKKYPIDGLGLSK